VNLRLFVRKGASLKWPRAEMAMHFIAMRLDKDLDEAMKIAIRKAIDLIALEKQLGRDDATLLRNMAVDFRVTRVVDETKGCTR
jgi:acetamidase/formamidase